MVIPAPNVLADNLSEVFTHFANNVKTHEFNNGYNFIESQQDVQFIERILRAFGWEQNHIDEFAFHEHPLNRTRLDSDLNDEGIEVVTSKTWADYWISSGEGAVIELKSPNNANGNPRPLTEENRQQLEEYWSSFPGGIRPRYLILSNFRTFQIYDSLHPDLTVQEIVVEFTLEQIYDCRGFLPFLNIQNPSAEFINLQEQMGEGVADTMSDARSYMINELGLGEDRATLFLMQIGLIMFLEDHVDINLNPVIPRAPSTRGVFHQLLVDIDQNIAMSPLLFTLMREGGQVGNDGQYGMPEISQDWYSADSCIDFALS